MWPEWFFIQTVPPNAETGTYDYRLVLISYAIASLTSYTAFNSANQLISAEKKQRILWHIGGAFSLGCGIWSMHFVGMLAFDMRMAMDYDPLLSLISLIVAWIVAFIALAVVRRPELRLRDIMLSAVLLGLGICAMHYTGMASMQMDGEIRYLPSFFFLSVIIAIAASAAALWLLFTLTRSVHHLRHPLIIASAFVMGAAICGMHYTGMSGTVFIPWANCRYDPNQNYSQLAMTLASVSIITLLSPHFVDGIANFFNRQDLSRRVFSQLSALLALLMVLVLSSFLFIVSALNDQKRDNLNVTVAGLQRTLIQRYLREVTSILAAQSIHDWQGVLHNSQQIAITEKIIDNNFNALKNGGEVIINFNGTKTDSMDKIDYPEAVKKLPLVHESWQEIKHAALIALRENEDYLRRESTYSSLAKMADRTTELQDDITQTLIKEMKEDSDRAESGQAIILILNLLCFIMTIYYAKLRVEIPIKNSMNKQKEMELQLLAHRDHLQQMVDAQTESLKEEALTIMLLQNVSSVANQARTIEDALRPILALICWYMRWQVGHVFMLDPNGKGDLVSSGIWYFEEPDKALAFKQQTESTRFAPGIGLPGRVMQEGRAFWIRDISKDSSFLRKDACNTDSLKTGVAFPINDNGKVLMVAEFYATQLFDLDEDALGLFNSIAMQLSMVLERKRIENSLIKAQREAEQANKLKSEFLANMSHELRTPMHSIITFSRQGIERKERWSADEQIENLSLIKKSGERLLGLLNDLLDLSKLEAGAMQYDFKSHDPAKIIEAATRETKALAEKKNLKLVIHNDLQTHKIQCDSGKIIQVLINLLSNAIKFSPEGKNVSLSCENYMHESSFLQLTISDEGMGIPPNELESVFNKFVQSSKTKTGAGGTGLGLAICKEIISAHSGKIWAENKPSGGTNFIVLLPTVHAKGTPI